MLWATKENPILESKSGVFSHAVAPLIVYSFILKGFPPALAEELILPADFPFLELLIVA